MRHYRTVYVTDGRIRKLTTFTSQGFTNSLNGAIKATASRLAVEQYPKAFIEDRRTKKTVVVLSNTGYGIHIVRYE